MRRDTGTAVRAVLAAALVSTLVAGCTGGGSTPQAATLSPTPSPTVSSVSPSASPTLTTEGQVEAAVRTYYTELTKAAQTQDTTKLRTLVDAGCPCIGAVQSINDIRRRGRSTPEAAWTLTLVHVREIEERLALVEVRYNVSAHDVLDKQGRTIKKFAAATRHLDLSLVSVDETWILANVFDLEA